MVFTIFTPRNWKNLEKIVKNARFLKIKIKFRGIPKKVRKNRNNKQGALCNFGVSLVSASFRFARSLVSSHFIYFIFPIFRSISPFFNHFPCFFSIFFNFRMQLSKALSLRRVLNSGFHPFQVIPKPDVWMKRERLNRFTAVCIGFINNFSSIFNVSSGNTHRNGAQ